MHRAGYQEHAFPQGPGSRTARAGEIRRTRHRRAVLALPRTELHRGPLRAAAAGRLLLALGPQPQRLRLTRRGAGLRAQPSPVLCQRHGKPTVLAGARPHHLRNRLPDLVPGVAARRSAGLPAASRHPGGIRRQPRTRDQDEDRRRQPCPALRRRRRGKDDRARRGRVRPTPPRLPCVGAGTRGEAVERGSWERCPCESLHPAEDRPRGRARRGGQRPRPGDPSLAGGDGSARRS